MAIQPLPLRKCRRGVYCRPLPRSRLGGRPAPSVWPCRSLSSSCGSSPATAACCRSASSRRRSGYSAPGHMGVRSADTGLNPYSGTWIGNVQSSLWRIGRGYMVGALLGVPTGVLIGRSVIIRKLIDPIIQGLRPVPITAWLPAPSHSSAFAIRARFFDRSRRLLPDRRQHHARRARGSGNPDPSRGNDGNQLGAERANDHSSLCRAVDLHRLAASSRRRLDCRWSSPKWSR